MTQDDELFQKRRALLKNALTNEVSDKTSEDYFEMKKIFKEEISQFKPYSAPPIEEYLLYKILDDCLFFPDDFITPTSALELSRILKIDAELRLYCQHQVTGNGIFAIINGQHILTAKTDVIAQALKLL